MATKLYRAPFDLKALDGAPEGSFRATFATLGVIDKDGDVTLPGAFIQGQPVKIAAWGHSWGDLTVGKGAIAADDQTAWVDGLFNLNTMAGREHYETVKFNGPEQEWSYGFEIVNSSPGTLDGRDVRELRSLNVFEVSPVMLGAGVATRTDEIKAADAKPMPQFHACRLQPPTRYDRFRQGARDHNGKEYRVVFGHPKDGGGWEEQAYRYDRESWTEAEARSHCKDHDGRLFEPASGKADCGCADGAPLVTVDTLAADAALLVAEYKAGQPQLSTQRRERLAALRAALHDLGVELDALLDETTPRDRGKALWLECQRIRARRLGVAV